MTSNRNSLSRGTAFNVILTLLRTGRISDQPVQPTAEAAAAANRTGASHHTASSQASTTRARAVEQGARTATTAATAATTNGGHSNTHQHEVPTSSYSRFHIQGVHPARNASTGKITTNSSISRSIHSGTHSTTRTRTSTSPAQAQSTFSPTIFSNPTIRQDPPGYRLQINKSLYFASKTQTFQLKTANTHNFAQHTFHKNRYKQRIPPSTHQLNTSPQAIHQRLQRPAVSVHPSPLRHQHRPLVVFQADGRDRSRVAARTRGPGFHVLGRYTHIQHKHQHTTRSHPPSHPTTSIIRLPHQERKMRPGPVSISHLHRSSAHFIGRRPASSPIRSISSEGLSNSEGLFQTPQTNSVRRTPSEGPVSSKSARSLFSSPTIIRSAIHPPGGPQLPDDSTTPTVPSDNNISIQAATSDIPPAQPSTSNPDSLCRRFRSFHRSPYQLRPRRNDSPDDGATEVAHQQQGDSSSNNRTANDSKQVPKSSNSKTTSRQHHSKSSGNPSEMLDAPPASSTILSNAPDIREADSSHSSVYTIEGQSGGQAVAHTIVQRLPSESKDTQASSAADASAPSSSSTVIRLIRESSQPSVQPICIDHAGANSNSSRQSNTPLGRSGSRSLTVCKPTFSNFGPRHLQDHRRTAQAVRLGSASVAAPHVVATPSTARHQSPTPSPGQRSLLTASGRQGLSPAQSTSMAQRHSTIPRAWATIVSREQLTRLAAAAWDPNTYKRYSAIFNNFLRTTNRDPFSVDFKHILFYAINKSSSPSYQRTIILAILACLKIYGIDLSSKVQLQLVLRGLRRQQLDRKIQPLAYSSEQFSKVIAHCRAATPSSATAVMDITMLALMALAMLRPSDVSRLIRSSIRIHGADVEFRIYRPKGAKLSSQQFSPVIKLSSPTLARLLPLVKRTNNSYFLFTNTHNSNIPLSSDRISSRVKQVLRSIGVAFNPRDLRAQAASHYAHAGVPMPSIIQLGTWRQDSTFFRHYLRHSAR